MAMRGKWNGGGTRLGGGMRKAVGVCACLSAVAGRSAGVDCLNLSRGICQVRHQDLRDVTARLGASAYVKFHLQPHTRLSLFRRSAASPEVMGGGPSLEPTFTPSSRALRCSGNLTRRRRSADGTKLETAGSVFHFQEGRGLV